jgi:flavin-dependent dehydrogenase
MRFTRNLKSEYDVVICGAGAAGLTLARQFAIEIPEASVLLIEGVGDKSRTNALQVGESTVEMSAHYLANVVQLKDYLETRHYHKWGFRWFFGSGETPLQERPEIGTSHASPLSSYQLDRALIEKDLKMLNAEMGIQMLEESEVDTIELKSEDGLHKVCALEKATKRQYTFKCRWVIDAMGRRRFLQKKLGIAEPHNPLYSAAWFRLKGRIDVCDLVPETEIEWHTRVMGNNRYYSTNHLMDNGRWVWLIPLASGQTSIGLVAHEDFFSFTEYNTYERLMRWLEKHEPALWRRICDLAPEDFQCLRHYSYNATQVFSIDRWACSGDAALFADPFRSPGLDQVGFANILITEMIKRDRSGQLTTQMVTNWNETFLAHHTRTVQTIQSAYHFFGDCLVCGTRLIWDNIRAFSVNPSQRFNNVYLDERKAKALQPTLERFYSLGESMRMFFDQWAKLTKKKYTYQFVDYFAIPRILDFYRRNLRTGKTEEELQADYQEALEYAEEVAQTIFLLAVSDTMPEMLTHLPSPLWVNAWAIGLDPQHWEADGLFVPSSKPRPLMIEQFLAMFGVTDLREQKPQPDLTFI